MNAVSAILLGCLLCLFGAFQAAAPGAEPPPPKLTPAEKKAAELAQAFLAGKGVKWGMPARVRRAAKGQAQSVGGEMDAFLVVYPTAARERAMLGERAVIVNIATQKVAFIPRE
jgi:hypothetical protein